MHEPLFQSATDAAQTLRRKERSSRELTEMLLARIEAVNPALNAVVELRREAALQEAAAADATTARGDDAGPLHGVPMTIKDSFNVAGLHTTWGNPAFKDFVADSDATVPRRLKQAGAIIVGKTNLAFMLGDFGQTANELYGVTGNPWDVARTPGGSSGGAAAALAAGMTFLEYGSDLVGSIRIPASFCGVYGLKPSVGTVPLTGFQPPGPPAGPSDMAYMSAIGPLGRSAPDLRTALRVTGGPEGQAAKAWSWALSPPRHRRLEEFRVGVVLDHPHAPVSSEVTAPLSNAVDALARAAWNRYYDDIDVFLCPVNFTPAFPHDGRPFEARTIATPEGDRPYTNQVFWVSHASLPGLPAVAAPVGRTPGGLPVGAQIVGPLHEDDTAITFAELLGDVTGGYEPPPR